MWGWSYFRKHAAKLDRVFPMYVGVILIKTLANDRKMSIPYVCGGDPYYRQVYRQSSIVFPMYVGVILKKRLSLRQSLSIPHVCRGSLLNWNWLITKIALYQALKLSIALLVVLDLLIKPLCWSFVGTVTFDQPTGNCSQKRPDQTNQTDLTA